MQYIRKVKKADVNPLTNPSTYCFSGDEKWIDYNKSKRKKPNEIPGLAQKYTFY